MTHPLKMHVHFKKLRHFWERWVGQ